jgi:uncharacterized protein (TIGR00297 family)
MTEWPRQAVHIAVGLIALTLRWLHWTDAAVLAGAAVGFNLVVLPRIAPGVFRHPAERGAWHSGTVLYPLSVLGLVLVFRERLDLVAAAWGILAAGDGMATLVGTTVASRRLPWNRDKSVGGLIAFCVAGTAAAALLLAWTRGVSVSQEILLLAAVAAGVAAFVETIPISLDDNITVPIAAAVVLGTATQTDSTHWAAALSATAGKWPAAAAANAAVALVGWWAGTVTRAGAVTGAIIGLVVVLGAGWAGWVVLLLTFSLASACTRLGRARKMAAGIAEGRGGRRGPGNALANTGLAAWAALLMPGLPDPSVGAIALVASLATAGSDTVASEVGKAFGRTTWSVLTWRRVPAGTTGAASLEGTLAGLLSAALIAWAAAALNLIPEAAVPIIAGAATAASLVEGLLGATLETRGMLNNDTLNAVNAGIGTLLTLGAWSLWM